MFDVSKLKKYEEIWQIKSSLHPKFWFWSFI